MTLPTKAQQEQQAGQESFDPTGGRTALPELIVIACGMEPNAGSEPGKGWWWSKALSEHFRLHIITAPSAAELSANTGEARAAGWIFYTPECKIRTWKYGIGYYHYHLWLNLALSTAREIAAKRPVVGLCHVVMGSFRVLPAYDQLGIPYVLGPLGGGEFAPPAFLKGRDIPWMHYVIERLRPHLNHAFALIPGLRRCMKGAELVLATSEEGCDVVRKMGARRAVAVFPDSYDAPVEIDAILAQRRTQVADVSKEVRVLWQGRPLWWKAPDFAFQFLRYARDRGVRVKLVMVTQWNDPTAQALKKMASDLRVEEYVEFVEPMARTQFLEFARQQHAFLATSLHDSGGIPLIEAQAQGLPCFTLALGGNREAASPDAGVSGAFPTAEAFYEASTKRLQQWQQEPQIWLGEVERGLHFSTGFSHERLAWYVEELIVPAFKLKA